MKFLGFLLREIVNDFTKITLQVENSHDIDFLNSIVKTISLNFNIIILHAFKD